MQGPGSIVVHSSNQAEFVNPSGFAYALSKAALNHLVRELAISLAPNVRVNGISPATVVKGSTMFPRDRVMQSLDKYGLAYSASESDDELRSKLACR